MKNGQSHKIQFPLIMPLIISLIYKNFNYPLKFLRINNIISASLISNTFNLKNIFHLSKELILTDNIGLINISLCVKR